MVRGLDHFRKYFKAYSEDFILVGGVASYLLLDEAGAARVRPTKDLDIVVIMKPKDDFLQALREYIRLGGYEIHRDIKDRASMYRFQKPKNEEFPIMIELFATARSELELYDGQHIIPLTDSAEVESISAILLDDEYYALIKKHAVSKDGIFILNEMALIPFKAKAYLEIKERGEDSKHWKKHRGDVINLSVNFLTEESSEPLTGKVREHFLEFMKQLKQEITSEIIQGACNQDISKDAILRLLEDTFLADVL